MPKCEVWFSSKFAAYFQKTYSQEHLWEAASVTVKITIRTPVVLIHTDDLPQ